MFDFFTKPPLRRFSKLKLPTQNLPVFTINAAMFKHYEFD